MGRPGRTERWQPRIDNLYTGSRCSSVSHTLLEGTTHFLKTCVKVEIGMGRDLVIAVLDHTEDSLSDLLHQVWLHFAFLALTNEYVTEYFHELGGVDAFGLKVL